MNLCAEVARHDGVASVVYDDLPPSRPMSVWTLSMLAYVIDGVVDREGQRALPSLSLIGLGSR